MEIINQVYEATWAQLELTTFVATQVVTMSARRHYGGGCSPSPQAVLSTSTRNDKVVTSLKNWAAEQNPEVGSQVSGTGQAKAAH